MEIYRQTKNEYTIEIKKQKTHTDLDPFHFCKFWGALVVGIECNVFALRIFYVFFCGIGSREYCEGIQTIRTYKYYIETHISTRRLFD